MCLSSHSATHPSVKKHQLDLYFPTHTRKLQEKKHMNLLLSHSRSRELPSRVGNAFNCYCVWLMRDTRVMGGCGSDVHNFNYLTSRREIIKIMHVAHNCAHKSNKNFGFDRFVM